MSDLEKWDRLVLDSGIVERRNIVSLRIKEKQLVLFSLPQGHA
jgi:hypothetical protein